MLTPSVGPSDGVSTAAAGNELYIDRILENPGLSGVSINDECIFKTHDRHLTSSVIAVFSESRFRLISQRLKHNQVQELVEKIWELLECRAGKSVRKTIPSTARQGGFPSPCILPEEEAAAYIKAYFEFVHPLYPFLERQAFERKAFLPNLVGLLEEEPAFSALYHAVLALGCQHVVEGSFDPGKGRAWQMFQVSLTILPHILLPPDSQATLQAITAMAVFGINIPGMQIDELFIEAARIATRMGCHRVISKRDTDSVSCYKTFWVIYILERMLCFIHGRSPILADYDIGCPIPETPESDVEGINFFLTAIRGGRILSKAYEMLFSVSATMKSTEQYFVAIDEIKSDLDRWTNSIPAKFRPGMPFNPGNTRTTFIFLRLHYMYHALVIALCRLELHIAVDQGTARMNNTRKLLMNTARTVIHLTTFIELKPYTPLWMLGTIPGSAMFILFDFVIHNATHVETDTNLRLLDTAAGYYGRLQYATGGSFPSMLMSGFAHIASDFVHRTRTENGLSSAAVPEGDSRSIPLMSSMNAPCTVDAPVPQYPNTVKADLNAFPPPGPPYSIPIEISPEPLLYPIEDRDPMMNDDLFSGINFTNFFDSVIPEF
ncbi:hypothetical protein AB5N19_13960 [Seiridium cardinale]|uniref:Xylanolytic transcriptional activator regulatory domain-containing protein n=1 Tax=Seiridium cardinale TaxID=138064 RepID=A0ABR2X9E7_9PEZI